MKKFISIIAFICLLASMHLQVFSKSEGKYEAEGFSFYNQVNFEIDEDIDSAYLIEAKTGDVLYAKNEFTPAPPASVTKIMTLLLVCEALEEGKYSLNDVVSISGNAASMGGSQIFLEEGERITVEELIKSTVIASGNDAAVALAELTAGSESAFVKLMNQKASQLGLRNTRFENTTGLDDTATNHYSCASDIGKMSRELIKHDIILKYSSIWQDTIRKGEFTLTNTNRLVRYYDGCNGLKTGSTDKAGFCVSATAKRGNMQLIAVIMGAESSAKRNEAAKMLLDYGFANFALYERAEEFLEQADVICGKKDKIALYSSEFYTVVDKSKISSVEMIFDIPNKIYAPLHKGDVLGSIVYKIDGEQIGKSDIIVLDDVDKITIFELFERIVKRILAGGTN